MRPLTLLFFSSILIGLSLLLSGCGNKGDLYLPDQQGQERAG